MARSRKTRAAALVSAFLSLCMVLTACAEPSEPGETPQDAVREEAISCIPSPPPASEPPAYQDVRVYFDGLLTDKAYLSDGVVFISPEAICAYYGLELRSEATDSGFSMAVSTLELTAARGEEYMEANGRYLFTPSGYLDIGGRIYLPKDVIERIFGITVSCGGEPLRADISTTGISLLQGGEDYYSVHFSTDDLYWLSHIIYAEAREQPLAGQIGVGNVVFNRVQSDDFPDTVFDVIFDRQYDTVQFDPISGQGVLEEPDELSLIAACLCLEGYNTVGESLFFVNPDRGDSSWFEAALNFVVTIGDHDFYV